MHVTLHSKRYWFTLFIEIYWEVLLVCLRVCFTVTSQCFSPQKALPHHNWLPQMMVYFIITTLIIYNVLSTHSILFSFLLFVFIPFTIFHAIRRTHQTYQNTYVDYCHMPLLRLTPSSHIGLRHCGTAPYISRPLLRVCWSVTYDSKYSRIKSRQVNCIGNVTNK